MLRSVVRLVCLLLAAFIQQSAEAQVIKQRDLANFLDNVYVVNDDDKISWEAVLKDAASRYSDPDKAIAEFANRVGAPLDKGRRYARLVIDAENFSKACDSLFGLLTCRFGPGNRFYEEVASLGLEEPSGELLINAGKVLPEKTEDQIAFAKLAFRHQQAGKILAVIYDYNRAPLIGAALLASSSDTVEKAIVTARASPLLTPKTASWQLAYLETAQETAIRIRQSALLRAALAQQSLIIKLKLGLTAEAIRDFEAYPQEVRGLLPVHSNACDGRFSCVGLEEDGAFLIDNLAASYRALRGSAPKSLFDKHGSIGLLPRSFDARSRANKAQKLHAALLEAISPQRKDKDLFKLFVKGENTKSASNAVEPDLYPSWKSVMLDAGPAVRKAVATRYRAAGYVDIADYIEDMNRDLFEEDPVGRGDSIHRAADFFPPTAKHRQAYWMVRLSAVRPKAKSAAQGPLQVHVDKTPGGWVEKPLPPGIKSWSPSRGGYEPVELKMPPGVNLPVPDWSVLRYAQDSGEKQILYQSSDYDMPGEVPAFGVWFQRTVKGKWSKPLYLGLQLYFPYVVTPTSDLPLLNDNTLRIEVRNQEINPKSISFPPIGLRYLRNEGGRFIEIPLSVLEADTDEDGLTDIEERRLGLRADNRDTDGDSMPDGWDPLPLTRVDRNAPRWKTAVAAGILEKLGGHESAAIIVPPSDGVASIEDMLAAAGSVKGGASIQTRMMVGDPDLFAGVSLPYRLLVYSEKDMEAMKRQTGINLPPSVSERFSSLDNRTHYVGWSAGWAGGSFLLNCDEHFDCDSEVLEEWVT